jgi:competence protein ComEC
VGRAGRYATLLAAVTLVVIAPGLLQRNEHSITFLSVGNADAIHIRAGSVHMLVDTAEEVTMQRTVLPYLASQGVNRLQLVFITHSHSDHAGGLPSLLRETKVGQVITGPDQDEVRRMNPGAPVITARTGMHIQGRGYSIRLLMNEHEGMSLNNRSAAMLVTCGTLRVIMAADLEREGEALLLSHIPPADVLKVAHHGSSSSSTQDFLAAVSPALAVISVGPNRYGHPAPAVLQRLESSGARVLRTDEVGAVRMVVRRQRLLVYGFARGRFELLGKYALPGRRVNGVVINWELPGFVAASQVA